MFILFFLVIAFGGATSECGICLETLKEGLYTLTELIETGIFGGCVAGCKKAVPQMWEACAAICTVVGEQVFVNLIKKADLDPIYACELLHLCESGPDCTIPAGCGNFTGHNIHPKQASIEEDPTIYFDLNFKIIQPVGISDIRVHVDFPDGSSVVFYEDDHLFHEGFPKVGDYNVTFAMALPDPGDCNVVIQLCEGWCESRHKHSEPFDKFVDTFELI